MEKDQMLICANIDLIQFEDTRTQYKFCFKAAENMNVFTFNPDT